MTEPTQRDAWDEYELTGRSPRGLGTLSTGGRNLDRLAEKARRYWDAGWTDLVITRRRVETARWESDWVKVDQAEFAALDGRETGESPDA